jgi:hypothetical protein
MSLDIHTPEHQRRLREADEQDAIDAGDYGQGDGAPEMAGIWLLAAALAIVVIAALSVLL